MTFDLRRIQRESFVRWVEYQQVLPSTNDRALELAAHPNVTTPILVLAEEQTAGRGRGTNRWWSAPGALTFTLVLHDGPMRLCSERWPCVSLTAALAVCEAVAPLVPQHAVTIRWPNDVYLAGRKLCGILPEFVSPAAVPPRLVLGIGINVNNSLADAPADVRAIGVSLSDLAARRLDPTDVLIPVLQRLEAGLNRLASGDATLAEAWAERCMLRNRTVELQLAPHRVRGICRGVDADGALILENHGQVSRYFAGIVAAAE